MKLACLLKLVRRLRMRGGSFLPHYIHSLRDSQLSIKTIYNLDLTVPFTVQRRQPPGPLEFTKTFTRTDFKKDWIMCPNTFPTTVSCRPTSHFLRDRTTRTWSDASEKQSVASRHTDYATLAHLDTLDKTKISCSS